MSRYIMAIDANKCINCKACVLACQQRNGTPYGHSRNWVRETPDKLSLFGTAYQPGACMHCDHPLCVEACPTHDRLRWNTRPTTEAWASIPNAASAAAGASKPVPTARASGRFGKLHPA